MAHLIFYRRGQELMRIALDRPRTTLGRGFDADVAVPDASLAALEAIVEPEGDTHRIRSLTGNPLRVGGQSVVTALLEDGSDVAFGAFRVAYHRHLPEGAEDAGDQEPVTMASHRGPQHLPKEMFLLARGSEARQLLCSIGETLVVGSGSQSDLQLSHPTVSAQHLKIQRHDGRLLVQDLASTNGTFLNGLRIYEAELPLGAHLTVGPWDLWVSESRSQLPGSAVEFEGMLSVDPGMHALFAEIEKVAASQAPVAISGETGTGKELVARALHRRSGRAGEWVPLNCSAIPRELMESELFGHDKGAFTGALVAREGALEEADRGTLFLDEVGDLPLELQAKLLRAVELGEVKRVGSSRISSVDVRFLCATHRILREEVRRNRFREDLYYRLVVVTLQLPPLRRRQGDVALLWDHFIGKLAPPGVRPQLSSAAREHLLAHGWPGNVRELRNVAQRALLSASGTVLDVKDIQLDERSSPGSSPDDLVDPRGRTLAEIEKQAIAITMRQQKGNRRGASRQLDIAKSTLLKKLADFGLEQEGRDPGESGDEE
jgi:DNA-binding NtrC family response regulator